MTNHRIIDHDDLADDVEYDDVGPHQRYTLALDDQGDLMFSDHTKTLLTVHNERAVEQSLKVAIGSVKGEDPLDSEFGTDVFVATQSYRHLEREVRRVLLHDDINHNRVAAVTNVDIIETGTARRVHVNAEVELDTGEIRTLAFELPA